MADFTSWSSYRDFASSVKRRARYVFEDHVVQFLRTVGATSQGRKIILPAGRILWRAQHGHDWRTERSDEHEVEVMAPFSPERMKPLALSAREGRVNPKGIPCLYMATTKETAMAEVRPWLGSYISVGQFKTLRDVLLVNCCAPHNFEPIDLLLGELSPEEREKVVWAHIDNAFSEPVSHDESTADYAPTQIMAEYFRANGYNGIRYRSSLGSGSNIALFDSDDAGLLNCSLYKVQNVSFDFVQTETPYFIRKHYENENDQRKAD